MADNRDRTGENAGEGRGRISASRAPRLAGYTFYGISRERYRELRDGCRKGAYSRKLLLSACSEVPELAEYILLSVREGLSYDELERQWELGKIQRMACGRTDFYGYRRLFYFRLDQLLQGKQA